MPEYLAPGVFIEEVSFRSKSIEGVSTTTTGFIGPCRFGPVTEAPDIITSLTEFERSYGDGAPLAFGAGAAMTGPNFVWHGLRSFFEEGGKRAYISRTFRPLSGNYPSQLDAAFGSAPHADGHARALVGAAPDAMRIVARYPGAAGNLRVRFGLQLGPNVLGALPDPAKVSEFIPTVTGLADGAVVWISSATAFGNAPIPPAPPPAVPPAPPAPRKVEQLPIYVAKRQLDGSWRFVSGGIRPGNPPLPADADATLTLADFKLNPAPGSGDAIRPLTLSIDVVADDGTRSLGAWSALPLAPDHKTAGVPDAIFDLFSLHGAASGGLPIVLLNDLAGGIGNGTDLLKALDSIPGIDFELNPAEWEDAHFTDELGALRKKLERGIGGTVWLAGGNDGLLPGRTEYEGRADPEQDYATGLKQLEMLEDIAIVAAPGSTWQYAARVNDVNAILNLLIAHAERMRYRIAVLDAPEALKIAEIRKLKAKLDSKHAALYYPWVTVFDPVSRQPLNLPPSGFVCGIYARNDTERAVWKAPANEIVRGAIGFETMISTAQQEVLNPEGINVFRFFEGRGFRLWGARTISSDPEWKYVNVRRYFAYLERSIDKGTQWAVFEPNGEALWANVRATIRDFLVNEWAGGALLGDKPEKAFFVRCDRSTMTQNDLDNGRLICLIGIAPLKPAEFVVFRIGQWTADAKT